MSRYDRQAKNALDLYPSLNADSAYIPLAHSYIVSTQVLYFAKRNIKIVIGNVFGDSRSREMKQRGTKEGKEREDATRQRAVVYMISDRSQEHFRDPSRI